MLDLRNMTFNGEPQAYCNIPMYIMQNLAEDKNLTSSAMVVYFRLFAYANLVNTGDFVITIAWVAKNTGLSRKTVERSLDLLKANGYITKDGLDFGAPKSKQTRATAKGYANHRREAVAPINTTSVTVHHLEPVLEVVTPVQQTVQVQQFGNTEVLPDVSSELNDILRSLGSTKKVGQIVQSVEKVSQNDANQVDKMTHSIGQNDHKVGQNDALHINNPNKQSKIKHSSTPSVTVGLLPSTSPRGFVEPSKPKPLASFLQSVQVGKPKPALHGKQTAYIETALQRMKVTSPSERARLQSEIAYAATQGAFSDTYSHTPLKAIRACLNLVEAGRWKPNVGMYA
jgi:hypothetical protein